MFTTVSPSDGFPNIAIYNVTETLLVDPQDVWITYETGEAIVTLFACHPKGSARQRIVVRGSLVTTTTLQGLRFQAGILRTRCSGSLPEPDPDIEQFDRSREGHRWNRGFPSLRSRAGTP